MSIILTRKLIFVLLLIGLFDGLAKAEVIFDGSLGNKLPDEPLIGVFDISESMGYSSSAGNLFFSFEKFVLDKNDVVTFSGLTKYNNLVSRVTGSEQSVIDGEIRTRFPDTSSPNFFLISPAGLVFGPNAKLDIQGDFRVSTADFVKFSDGQEFGSIKGDTNTTLSSAPIEAFGFLKDRVVMNIPDIEIKGSNFSSMSNYDMSFVGREISVTDGVLGVDEEGLAVIPGKISFITRSNEEGIAYWSGERLESSRSIDLGDISFKGKTQINATNLVVQAKNFYYEGVNSGILFIENLNTNLLISDTANIAVSNEFKISNGAKIKLTNENGKLFVNAKSVALENEALIESTNDFGSLEFVAEELSVKSGSRISTSQISEGNAGDIKIDVGPAGTVNVEGVSGNKTSRIESATFGSSESGNITIDAGSIIISDKAVLQATSNGVNGIGGGITLRANDVYVKEGAKVTADAFGGAQGGSIFIDAQNLVSIENSGSTLTALAIGENSSGRAGNITVAAKKIKLDDFGVVNAEAFDGAKGGEIFINTKTDLIVQGKSQIFAKSEGTGSAGSIKILAGGSILLTENGVLDEDLTLSLESKDSNAGNITLVAGDRVDIKESKINTNVRSQTGLGGDISIYALGETDINGVLLTGGSKIQADAIQNKAGNVTIVGSKVLVSGESSITANSEIDINKGEIAIISPDFSPTSGAIDLPETYFDASSLIANRCASQDKSSSSFIVAQRYGLSESPDLLLAGYEDYDGFISADHSTESISIVGDAVNTVALARINCSR